MSAMQAPGHLICEHLESIDWPPQAGDVDSSNRRQHICQIGLSALQTLTAVQEARPAVFKASSQQVS